MERISLKEKRSVIVLCAVLFSVCLVIHEVFLFVGNYIITNYSGDTDHFPVFLIPFAPDGIVQQIFFMSILFLVPYAVLLTLGILWLYRAIKYKIRFYIYASVFCGVTLMLYIIMRWCYVFEPLIAHKEGYPYMSLLELIVDF